MKDFLIGHRGEPVNWPENSLAGYEAVLKAGAGYIETDVQLTADGIPILSHDPSLLKVTGKDLAIPETAYAALSDIPAGYQERFNDKYQDYRIARLDELVDLLAAWPAATIFVEVKHGSLVTHGNARVVDTVMRTIQAIEKQCVLISFELDALNYCRDHYRIPIGWVLPEWSDANHSSAVELAPEYLFCNRKRLPADTEAVWQGPWQWAVYTVNDADEARAFLDRGIQLVETNIIRELMSADSAGDTERG